MAESARIECDRCHQSIFTKTLTDLEGLTVPAPLVMRVIAGTVPGAPEVDVNAVLVPEHVREVLRHGGRLDLCVPCFTALLGPEFTSVPPTA